MAKQPISPYGDDDGISIIIVYEMDHRDSARTGKMFSRLSRSVSLNLPFHVKHYMRSFEKRKAHCS